MTYPFVLRNQLKSWPLAGKAPTDLIGILGDQLLKMRVGQKLHSPGTILWETDCQYVTATMKDFVDWNEMKTMATNPLAKFSPKDFWCYIDYKEMFCLFEDSVLEVMLNTVLLVS